MKAKSVMFARRCLVAAALAPCMFAAGCVSFTIGDDGTPTRTISVRRSLARDADNEIDEIEPVVTRQSPHSATLMFKLHGTFVEEVVSETIINHKGEQLLSAGFFPGSACDKDAGAQVGTAFKSVWYNILFGGLPTVSGLLIEPFIPAGSGSGSAFSRSAIIGFHRWGGERRTENRLDSSRTTSEVVPLVDYSCDVAGATAVVGSEGICTVNGISAGAKRIEVTLSVSPRHPLGDLLAPFTGVPITINMPEE